MRYGKFFVKRAAAVGDSGAGATVVPAPATAPAVDSGVAELQKQNALLAAKLARFDGIDPSVVKQLTAKFASEEEKKLLEKGGVEAVVEGRLGAMKADFDKKEKAFAERLAKLSDAQLTSTLVQAASKGGVLATAIDDVIYRAKAAGWGVGEDGNISAGGMRGKDGKPLSVDEWIDSLKTTAPHFYNTPQGGGGISSGSGAGGAVGAVGNLAGNSGERIAAIKKMFPELK